MKKLNEVYIMCGHEIYDILTLMFEGLSAFGTVGAVIFSLYVLLDSKRIKYKIKADSVIMMGQMEPILLE